jgi:hypothetical protein
MKRPLIVIDLMLVVGTLMAAIGQPMNKVGSCTITATTTATPVQTLAVAACGAPLPAEAFMAWTASTTPVCFGGSDGDTVVDAGGTCWPVCTTAANCRFDYYSARAAPDAVWIVRPTGLDADGGVDTTVTSRVTVHAGGPL